MNPNTQADLGKLILRVALGVLILLHGIAKLKGGVSGIVGTPPPVRGEQGAARWEINTNTGTLTPRSMLVTTTLTGAQPPVPGWNAQYDLWNERSLQIDNGVYQLSGGQTFYKVGD